jgi:hypothetical protein
MAINRQCRLLLIWVIQLMIPAGRAQSAQQSKPLRLGWHSGQMTMSYVVHCWIDVPKHFAYSLSCPSTLKMYQYCLLSAGLCLQDAQETSLHSVAVPANPCGISIHDRSQKLMKTQLLNIITDKHHRFGTALACTSFTCLSAFIACSADQALASVDHIHVIPISSACCVSCEVL